MVGDFHWHGKLKPQLIDLYNRSNLLNCKNDAGRDDRGCMTFMFGWYSLDLYIFD